MDSNLKKMLEQKARDIRLDIIDMLCAAGSGHPGGSLSIADIFSTGIESYFPKGMPVLFFMQLLQ